MDAGSSPARAGSDRNAAVGSRCLRRRYYRPAGTVGGPRREHDESDSPRDDVPMLVWCLRYVEEFAEDIIRAKELHDAILERDPDQPRPGDLQRWKQYLDGLRRTKEHFLAGGSPAIGRRSLPSTWRRSSISVRRRSTTTARTISRSRSVHRSISKSRTASAATPGPNQSTSTKSTRG